MVKHLLEVSRRRKRRWALIRLLGWIAVGIIVVIGFFSLFYVKSLRVSRIEFIGAKTLSREDLSAEINKVISKRYFYVLPKDHILFLPEDEIETVLSARYRIQEFVLNRKFPDTLSIKIKERRPWAIWCHKQDENLSNCAVSDRSGFVFAVSPTLSGSAVLKVIDRQSESMLGKHFAPSETVGKIVFLIEKIGERLGEQITLIEPQLEGVYHLSMEEGWYLIIDGGVKQEKALENLLLALDKIGDRRSELEYIDLRFSNKVFYKYKNTTTASGAKSTRNSAGDGDE